MVIRFKYLYLHNDRAITVMKGGPLKDDALCAVLLMTRMVKVTSIHIFTISNDRYFSAGFRYLLKCKNESASNKYIITELPFHKEVFDKIYLKKIRNSSCDYIIFDCGCGFINYHEACSMLYAGLVQGTLTAKVILFYENNLCLTNPDMYNYFITVDKNTPITEILGLITTLSNKLSHSTPSEIKSEEDLQTRQYLTGRELSIINEIYNGLSPSDIAKKLKLNVKTIRGYKCKAMKKIRTKKPLVLHSSTDFAE